MQSAGTPSNVPYIARLVVIETTDGGYWHLNTILARLLHPWNAQLSMLVTELGIVMTVKPVQLRNAHVSIRVTVFGMIVFLQPTTNLFVLDSITALQSFRLSYTVLSPSTVMDVKLLQSLKAPGSIRVTDLGMETDVNPLLNPLVLTIRVTV